MTAVKSALKDKGKLAVELALAGSWSEAVEMNRQVLREHPGDVEAYNRLGKALTELGSVEEAISAFEGALLFSPHNAIARRNLERLTSLRDTHGDGCSDTDVRRGQGGRRRAHLTEETGKSAVVPLVNVADPAALSGLMPGDATELVCLGNIIRVVADGARIGQVEPRHGARISKLMSGGNRYEASIKEIQGNGVSLLIREIYKHPSQLGMVSFPSKATVGPRVYGPSRYANSASMAWRGRNEEATLSTLRDWSSDDTEPGDDEELTPEIHRVINSPDDRDDIY